MGEKDKDKDKKKSAKKSILRVELASINDIVRYVYTFDHDNEPLFTSGSKPFTLFALGETIDDVIIVYTAQSESQAKALAYDYSPSEGTERVRFVDSISEQRPDSAYIDVVQMDLSNFEDAEKIKKESISAIKLGFDGLAKSLIRKAISKESLEHAYLFDFNGKSMIGAFDIFEELSSGKVFYMAELKEQTGKLFARYDYTKDRIDFSNTTGEHSYMYVKLIKLKAGFPFLR